MNMLLIVDFYQYLHKAQSEFNFGFVLDQYNTYFAWNSNWTVSFRKHA